MSGRIEIAADLIERLKEGEGSAFRAVYDATHSKIFQTVLSVVKDSPKAEEIVQDTFLALWVNRARLDGRRNLYPYIHQTAKRLAIDHFRRCVLEKRALKLLALTGEHQTRNTEETVAHKELERLANETVKRLPGQQQAVFMMSRMQGLSYDEIANQLQISPNTVRNHMVSALKFVKMNFDKTGFVSLALSLCLFF